MANRRRSRGIYVRGRRSSLSGTLGLLTLCLGMVAAGSLPLAAGPSPYAGDPSLPAAAIQIPGSADAGDPFRSAWLSPELDETAEVAWGDYDADGDLDLAVGNSVQPNRIYRNDGIIAGVPQLVVVWSSAEVDATSSIAWGDVDGDGDLDLAVGNWDGQPNRLYRHDGVVQGTPIMTLVWSSTENDYTSSIAWGDVDGDGDLDLAVGNTASQPNRLYRNDGGVLTSEAVWSSDEHGWTSAVAWGDYDTDGDLDLAVGNSGEPDRLYRNEGRALTSSAVWSSAEADYTHCIAWGDAEGDGDMDLVVGSNEAIRLYRNDGVIGDLPQMVLAWSSAEAEHTNGIAWGDYDADGDLDLAAGNYYWPIRVYRNDGVVGGLFQIQVAWSALQAEDTVSVAWGDYDGDGDLDLAVGNAGTPAKPNRLYRNDGVTMATVAAWSTPEEDNTSSVAWGDYDGDGDLDLAVGNWYQPGRLYRNDSPLRGLPRMTLVWSSAAMQINHCLAWGDYDGDGDLDLAVGNGQGQLSHLYRNDGAVLTAYPVYSFTGAIDTSALAWGDYDGDGDLDLALAGQVEPVPRSEQDLGAPPPRPDRRSTCLYRNDGVSGGTPRMQEIWSSAESDLSTSIAWGDVDSDGDLDLAVGNRAGPNRLYGNEGGRLTIRAVWSSDESDWTDSVAWGDYDGDGDLDLAAGNGNGQANRIYRNEGGMLLSGAFWSSDEMDWTTSVAWGDVDGDGDLDLAVGNGNGQPNRLYRNEGGSLTPRAVWSSAETDTTVAVAWGDVDGDGDLDLVVGNTNRQPNRLYRNMRDGEGLLGSVPLVRPVRPGIDADFYSLPWIWAGPTVPITYTLSGLQGDPVKFIRTWYSPDGGGRWLPAVAATGTVTTNLGTTNPVTWTYSYATPTLIPDPGTIASALWVTPTDMIADVDVSLNLTHTWDGQLVLTLTAPFSRSVLLIGRRGGDGDNFTDTVLDDEAALPIVSGTAPFSGRYRPEQALSRLDGYSPQGPWTLSVADIASGEVGTLLSWGITVTLNGGAVYTYSWDVGRSGVFGQLDNTVFRIQAVPAVITGTANAVPGPFLYGAYAAQTFPFRVRGTQVRVISGTTPISNALVYRLPAGQVAGGAPLADRTGTPFRTDAQGYLQGRGEIGLGDRLLALLPTHQALHYAGVLHLSGGNDHLVRNTLHSAPITATTVSFWMRSEDSAGRGTPFSYATPGEPDALLLTNYNDLTIHRGAVSVTTGISLTDGDWHHVAFTWRSADGQVKLYKDGAAAFTGTLTTTPLITGGSLVLGQDQDSLGGGFDPAQAFAGELDEVRIWRTVRSEAEVRADMFRLLHGSEPGLVVYWPFNDRSDSTAFDRTANGNDGTLEGAVWVGQPLGGYTVYHTSAEPTLTGLAAFTVTHPGVQVLTVTAAYPLLLYDLDLSLEWDAHNEPPYLWQLESDLRKASQHLYDFTDGQVALGHVTVHQNGDYWDSAHVAVQATNRLRPLAVQGGVVLTPTVDPQHEDIVYGIGQVRMGATWNRYGDPGGIGGDWPLALAHELSHFFLYLDDVYLGLNEDDLLIPLDSCTGSAMGDMYDPDNTEFIYDEGRWSSNCADTLANRTLQRDEWQTIRLWYPWLVTPTVDNAGPSLMPFDFTAVEVRDPLTPTATLPDPTFFVDYVGGVAASSAARAFLLRDVYASVDGHDQVLDLGSPLAGQNRVLARGAQPGDRLCVFDPVRHQYGCEAVEQGDDRLMLERDESWQALIQLRPVTTQTFAIQVGGLTGTLDLRARLYPEHDLPSPVITLTQAGGLYSGTLQVLYPTMVGHVQVWVEEPAGETNPRREAIAGYAMGGNTGEGPFSRGHGPFSRGHGPFSRGHGPFSRGHGAPAVSLNGEMILFTANPIAFEEGELFTVQSMAGLPPLPDGKTAIGQGYHLVTSPNVTRTITGSISFQYLTIDVLVEQADEEELSIHYWDGRRWRALDTVGDPYYNLVSAPGQGSGVYALLAGVTVPHVDSVVPSAATNEVTTTLILHGGYFLEPLEVALVGITGTYTLPLAAVSPVSVTAVVTPGLPACEYRVVVVNSSQPGGPAVSPAPGTFALYDPAAACFYDFFQSGAGRWQRSGDWDIVVLPSGERAMTDSPEGPYKNAEDYGAELITYTTYVTSQPFDLQGCSIPVLLFRHDYVIDDRPPSQDLGRVEISTDAGTRWTELAHFSGGYPTGLGAAGVRSSEWAGVRWTNVEIDLSGFTGTVQIRFGLQVDRYGADKGWVIDDVIVRSGTPAWQRIFLPLVLKETPGR